MRLICFYCLLFSLCSVSVHAEPRLALLIGNGAGYLPRSESNVLDPLPEPERDVDMIEAVLRGNGFVIPAEFILKNAGQAQIRAAVDAFVLELAKPENAGATAWFFYAGHGVQGDHPELGTQNYLIPVGRAFLTNDDVIDGGVSAKWILAKLTGNAKVSIMILDACRNKMPIKTKPGARGDEMRGGFAGMKAEGAIIGFATDDLGSAYGEGRRGNGLYTKYLVDALEKYKHLPMSTVFETVAGLVADAANRRGYKQTPWYNSGLQVKDGQAFCLGGCGDGGDSCAAQWKPISDSRAVSDFEGFLAQCGDSDFAELARFKLAQLAPEPPPPTKDFTDPVTGMAFAWISGGCFQMGSPESEEGRQSDETRHEACVDGFWLAKTEVTNAQYRKFKSDHDSGSYKEHGLNADNQPAVNVSWQEAVAFTEWLNQQNNGRFKFRLPTEAEWEYAARAGTTTARYWGENPDQACGYANVADQTAKREWSDWVIHNCDDGYHVTAPVGKFRPNAFGLYDMLGNAWEWTCSEYGSDGNAESTCSSKNHAEGRRVLRGGSWSFDPRFVRSAYRLNWSPDFRGDDLGFRLARMF